MDRIRKDLLIPVNGYGRKKHAVYFGDHQGQKREEWATTQRVPPSLTELSHGSRWITQFPFTLDQSATAEMWRQEEGTDSPVCWLCKHLQMTVYSPVNHARPYSPFIPSSAAFHMQSGHLTRAGLWLTCLCRCSSVCLFKLKHQNFIDGSGCWLGLETMKLKQAAAQILPELRPLKRLELFPPINVLF